jgi:hypothetical protein
MWRRFTVDEALRTGRIGATFNANGEQFVDLLGDGHQLRHDRERFGTEVLV